jgi:flagellar hook-basal body complex protein FliE
MNRIEANDLLSRMHEMALHAKTKESPQINAASQSSAFSSTLTNAISQVNDKQVQFNTLSEAFERGEAVELSDVMIASQKSTVAFQSLLQVRNRFVSAYQEIMNMNI